MFSKRSGLAGRGMILDQIKGEPALNYDPQRGPVTKSAVASMGPIL